MAKNINYVSHKKSKLKDSNGKPQLPSASALVEGEIAINYAENVETLSIKNESGTVVTFSSDNYYTKQKLGNSFVGDTAKTVAQVIEENEQTIAAALNELENEKLDITDFNTHTGDTSIHHTHSNKAALDSITGTVGTMAYQNTSSYSSATQVSTALGDKADKATTIAGYGITDAKIANQVITLGTNSVTVSSATQVNTALGTKVNSATYTGHTADTSIHFTTGAVQTQINNSISGKVDTNTFNTIVGSGYTNTTITDAIENMDEAVAAALTNLDDNKIGKTIEITWANLKSARDNSTLIPGQWYRITDYVTTTMQDDTQSAGHQFDIIVRADDVNALNENAFAAKHGGDTYFTNAGAKLEAWRLKYTLDNKYWSLVPYGEQIISSEGNKKYYYSGTMVVDGTTYYKWVYVYAYNYISCSLGTSVGDTLYYYDNKNERLIDYGYTIIDYIPSSDANGKGTIYWMKDEFDNECSYDFKNIQFKFTSAIENSGIVANVFYYTFSFASGDNDATITDHSLVKYCIRNKVIFMGDDNDRFILPFNVFRCNRESALFSKNTIFGNAKNNTFSSAQYNEIIGMGCRNNSFSDGCSFNKIHGIDCSYNTFYVNCISNNLFGECSNNIIGTRSYGNKFEYSSSITLGARCEYNTFESGCRKISLGERCKYNTFGTSCRYITFGTSESTKSYCQYIIVENGNQYIYLDCSATTSSSAYFQNVKIAQGVNNTTTYKTITHTTAGDTFQTIYKPANSVEVSV